MIRTPERNAFRKEARLASGFVRIVCRVFFFSSIDFPSVNARFPVVKTSKIQSRLTFYMKASIIVIVWDTPPVSN